MRSPDRLVQTVTHAAQRVVWFVEGWEPTGIGRARLMKTILQDVEAGKKVSSEYEERLRLMPPFWTDFARILIRSSENSRRAVELLKVA